MRLPVRPPSRPIVVSPSDAAILSLALRLLQAKVLRASASSKVSNCYGIKRLTWPYLARKRQGLEVHRLTTNSFASLAGLMRIRCLADHIATSLDNHYDSECLFNSWFRQLLWDVVQPWTRPKLPEVLGPEATPRLSYKKLLRRKLDPQILFLIRRVLDPKKLRI